MNLNQKALSFLKKQGFLLLCVVIILLPLGHTMLNLPSIVHDGYNLFSADFLQHITFNTLSLVLQVGVISIIVGVFFAWYVKLYKIRGHRWIHFLLLLPLVIPSYVHAFIFIGVWDYSGVFQNYLRALNWLNSGVDVRDNSWGISLALSFNLSPYVYLMTCASFDRQSDSTIRACRIYAQGHTWSMVKILVKLIRPGIIAGVTLVMMEVIADFGVVSMFNYQTFTLAIYSAWEDYRDILLALFLAFHLLIISLLLIALEQKNRGQKRFDNIQQQLNARIAISPRRQWFFYSICLLWMTFSTFVPIIQLLSWSIESFAWESRYIDWLWQSVKLTFMGTAGILLLSLMINYCKYVYGGTLNRNLVGILSVGYALPGTMIAMILLLVFNEYIGQNLSGVGVLILLWGYCIRFLSLGLNALATDWEAISPSLEKANKLYSRSFIQQIQKFYLPMLKPGIMVGAVLLSLEIIKELPITLILRPYGWDTLAIRIYNLASEGLYEQAAPAALLLVLFILILYGVIALLTRQTKTQSG